MLDYVKASRRTRHRDPSRAAFTLIVIALALLGRTTASAQWGQPVAPHLQVEFRLTLMPDKEAQSAGAVPFSNQVGMAGGIWIDQFTGFGCILGPFEPSAVDLRSLSEGDAHPFGVSLRSRAKDDVVSRIEWKGQLEDGKISGDVWITMPGTPLTADAIAAKRIDRNQAKRNATVVRADGTVVNERAAEYAAREADRKNALLAIQGRRLHFTFSTAEVIVIPIGSWSARKPPATRPSTAEAARK